LVLGEIFDRFVEESPISVMGVGMVERVLSAEKIDRIFNKISEVQYTRELLFSTVFELLSYAVFRIHPSVHAAYQAHPKKLNVTIPAVYDKLKGVEAKTLRELVRYSAGELCPIIKEMEGELPPLLPGYHTKILDGNCIEGSEHRLKELRGISDGALPGKSLVVLDPSLMLAVDVFPCEDGHAQERSLLSEVLKSVETDDLWIGDRNFCTRDFLIGIDRRGAFFVIRQHGLLPFEELEDMGFVGENDSGVVYEQQIRIVDKDGKELICRRVKVELNKATRDGDKEIYIITNLPLVDAFGKEVASALIVCELYLRRWTLEGMFQELESHLNSEINTLAYPKAALFAFCVALIAYNTLSVVKAALRVVHTHQKIEEEVSGYYIADEVSGTYRGMMIAIPQLEWEVFHQFSIPQLGELLVLLAKKVDLEKYKKHPRRPKKPPPKRKSISNSHHVSTARLIAARKKREPPSDTRG
jgi:IS4 transposase